MRGMRKPVWICAPRGRRPGREARRLSCQWSVAKRNSTAGPIPASCRRAHGVDPGPDGNAPAPVPHRKSGIDERGRFTNAPCPHPVQRQYCLLFQVSCPDNAHVWPAHRLADRLRIIAVLLVVLAVRHGRSRRHEPHLMPRPAKFAGPLVGVPTGLHAGQTGRQLGQQAFVSRLQTALSIRLSSALSTPSAWETLCPIDADTFY